MTKKEKNQLNPIDVPNTGVTSSTISTACSGMESHADKFSSRMTIYTNYQFCQLYVFFFFGKLSTIRLRIKKKDRKGSSPSNAYIGSPKGKKIVC